MVVFIFYEMDPWAAFELQLVDPRFYQQLNLEGDGELVISHDDLTHSVRAFAFPDPQVGAATRSPSL